MRPTDVPATSAPPVRVPTVSTTSAPTTSPPKADAFTASLDAVLANSNSCLVVTDDRTGAVVYSHNATVPFAPASTQKLLVAAAALDQLGAGYRFVTTVVAARPPVAGRVDDLWLVGGGDPLLASPAYGALVTTPGSSTAGYEPTPISALADAIAARGIRAVRNGVHGDDSRFESLRYLPTWPTTTNVGEFDIGPLSALELDQGLDRWRPAIVSADPAAHAAEVLASLLAARGVAAGPAGDGPPPPGGVIVAAIPSPPLSQLVSEMLQASDNQIAELLVRELDRHAGGRGTTAGGVALVMREAARLGLPTAGLSLVDGSGLSPSDRATCVTLLGALSLGDAPPLAALETGLPVAGVSGTLATLFRGTSLAGRLAAKGGYITGVTGLVGRLDGAHPVRFAFLANGPFSYPAGLGLSERVVTALAAR